MYEAIGHMLCQWAHLEQAMNDSLFELDGATTDDAQRRLGQQQFKTRLGKWQKLIAPHVKHRIRRGALNVFCDRVTALKSERDEIAHGYWGIDEGRATLFKFKYALLVDLIEMDGASVQRLASRISVLNARLFCLKGLHERAQQP
jgi:hypothetical protein